MARPNTTSGTMILLHVDDTGQVADVINGKPYKLPFNEPFEVDRFIGNAILRHIGHLHGIVEVQQVKTKTGVEYLVDEAREEAHKYVTTCEKSIIDFYIRQQMEDRIAAGKPALPPTGKALAVCIKRKINLRVQYGITPVGWTDPGESLPHAVSSAVGEQSKAVEEMRRVASHQAETITALQADLANTNQRFETLMNAIQEQNSVRPAMELEEEPEPEQEQDPEQQL